MNSKNSRKILLLSMAMVVLVSQTLHAQILGPLLPASTMELGAQVRWLQVDFYNIDSSDGTDQYDVSIPLRYGVTEYATLSAELFIGNEDFNSRDREIRYYTLGGGFQALIWKKNDYLVTGAVHFSESLIMARSNDYSDFIQIGLISIIQLQRTVRWRNQAVTLWGGPLHFYFSYRRMEDNRHLSATWHIKQPLGFAVGANFLFLDHYQFYYTFMYADYYQPRLGLSYQF